MAVYEILEEIMGERGASVAEIARICNLPDSTVRGIIKRKQETIALEVAFKISDGLGVSLEKLNGIPEREHPKPETKTAPPYSDEAMQLAKDYDEKLDTWGQKQVRDVADNEILRCKAEKQKEQEAERQARAAVQKQKQQMEAGEEIAPEGGRIIELPFDELKASAGTGYELDYDRLVPWKVIYNEMTRKADFCLEVDGRSMEPIIHDGDIILVRQQPAVDEGEIGLFTVGDKGFVKKQGEDRLISINDAFEDIFPGEYDVFVCRGKVIGVLDPAWIVKK